MNTLAAAKAIDDISRVRGYSDKLLELVKKEFRTKTISIYDYERFINLLTCLNLQAEDIKNDMNSLINKEHYKQYHSINIQI